MKVSFYRYMLAAFAAASLAASGAAFAQGMVLFIHIDHANPNPVRPTAPIDNIRELADALRRCWTPPPADARHPKIDVTFSISFKRSGELFGKPKVITFVQPVTDEQRGRYYAAVAEALDLCSRMPFTDSMGGAVAGRVFRVNYLDDRNSKKAENTWPTGRS